MRILFAEWKCKFFGRKFVGTFSYKWNLLFLVFLFFFVLIKKGN